MAYTNKKLPMKYSCEELHERMASGLCIFCDEKDLPGHYNLKHKRSRIFMIEGDEVPDNNELISVALDQEEDLAKTISEEKWNPPIG